MSKDNQLVKTSTSLFESLMLSRLGESSVGSVADEIETSISSLDALQKKTLAIRLAEAKKLGLRPGELTTANRIMLERIKLSLEALPENLLIAASEGVTMLPVMLMRDTEVSFQPLNLWQRMIEVIPEATGVTDPLLKMMEEALGLSDGLNPRVINLWNAKEEFAPFFASEAEFEIICSYGFAPRTKSFSWSKFNSSLGSTENSAWNLGGNETPTYSKSFALVVNVIPQQFL